MYIFKENSRNAYNNERHEDDFRENVLKHFRFNLPHTDTSDEVLRELPPGELEALKTHLTSGLIEQKFFRKFRFRLRWKIENEGFNSQKNLGYELEHKFSRVSFIAMQNYYQLLQIAHIINQLVERSKQVVALLEEHSKQTIVDLWIKMIAYLIFSHAEENILTPSLPD